MLNFRLELQLKIFAALPKNAQISKFPAYSNIYEN